MAFTLPDFNLTCEIFAGPYDTRALRISGQVCNLAMGKRTTWGYHDPTVVGYGIATATLLLPPLVDIRENAQLSGPFGTGVYDIVEVPSGSGRWYTVNSVDDIGKGFPNEHRWAGLAKLSSNSGLANTTNLYWPIPMP
jgi:hypothetical protein